MYVSKWFFNKEKIVKRIYIIMVLLTLCSCVKAGEFTPQRHHLHEMNRTETCAQDSRKCIPGTDIPW